MKGISSLWLIFHRVGREVRTAKNVNTVLAVISLTVVTGIYAQTESAVQHAAASVAHLHDSMLDPASFALDAALVSKPDKHGAVSFCYAFRSHNAMGGYAEGRAIEKGGEHLTIVPLSSGGTWIAYDVGWGAPCKAKNIDRDITADVNLLAPTLYKKTK